MTYDLLKRAEILSIDDPAGKAVTLNNLAVYFRRLGKLHTALRYLKQAAEIEAKLPRPRHPGDVHVNLCAVYSQVGNHRAAVKAGQTAIDSLTAEMFTGNGPGGAVTRDIQADRIATLALAYHNLGIEYEFLAKLTQAMASYNRGVELAHTYLGAQHGITITLRNSQVAAKREIEKRKKAKQLEEEANAAAAEKAAIEAARRAQERLRASLEGGSAGTSAELPAQADTPAARAAAAQHKALRAKVLSSSLSGADTAYGQGKRPKPSTQIALERRLSQIARAPQRTQKLSSASQLSIARGTVRPAAAAKPLGQSMRSTMHKTGVLFKDM